MKTILSLCTFMAATASMNAQSSANSQSGNLLDVMSGYFVGTNIINYSGDPTSTGPYVMINGIRSFIYQSPLIIVDGIIYDGDVSSINPNDVEYANVIDDPATLAKYGNRANNGVIAITTKTGKRKYGEPKERINFRGKWGVNSDAIGQYDLATADEYRNFMMKDDYFSQRLLDTEVKTVNNYDDYFRNGMRQEYNVDYAKEFDKGNVFASIGFLDNNGLFKDNSYKRLTARVNARYNPTENIKLGINTSFTFDKRKKSVDDNEYMLYIMAGAPLTPTYYASSFDYSIPELDYKQTASVFSLNAFADFKLTDALHLNANMSCVSNNPDHTSLSKIGEFDINNLTDYNWSAIRYDGYFQMNSLEWSATYTTLTPEVKLTWHKDWDNSALYLQGGYMHHSITKDMSGKEQYLKLRPYSYHGYTTPINTYEYDEYDAVTASCDWYKGYLTVNANVRLQNSSLYKEVNDENKWFTNWGVKTAWSIPVKGTEIDEINIYAGYGETGNDKPLKYYTNRYSSYPLLYDLDYEKTRNFKAGGYISLYNCRLIADVHFFHNVNHNAFRYASRLRYERDVYSNVCLNDGDISNTGVSLSIKGPIILDGDDFRWDMSLNLTHYRNKITNCKGSIEGFDAVPYVQNELKDGDDITSVRLPEYAGIDNNNRTLYYAEDGSTTTDTYYARIKNYGKNTPDLFGGFGNTIRCRNFDFHLGLGFQIGGKVFDSNYYEMMYCDRIFTYNIHKDLLEKGKSHSDRVQYDCFTDASYLNINKVVLGYTLPKETAKSLHVRTLRIYADADNLAFISARKGMDPRNLSYYGAGVNVGFYPMMRTVSFGVEVGL